MPCPKSHGRGDQKCNIFGLRLRIIKSTILCNFEMLFKSEEEIYEHKYT